MKDDRRLFDYGLVFLWAAFAVFLLLFVATVAHARIDDLSLQRMILYGSCEELGPDDGIDPNDVADGPEFDIPGGFPLGRQGAGLDTRANPPRAQGSLRIESDASYIIRNMRFDAWFRGASQPILDDRTITLDYVPNGAWYEVQSLWDNERYYVTFIRRAPPGEGYDPAIIFAVRIFSDCVVQVDYRYTDGGF